MVFKVDYVDWKGRDTYMYICADSLDHAAEIAKVMQGVTKIKNIEEMAEC